MVRRDHSLPQNTSNPQNHFRKDSSNEHNLVLDTIIRGIPYQYSSCVFVSPSSSSPFIIQFFLVKLSFLFILKSKKVKAVPLQACSGPQGSRNLRFPDYMTMAQDGGKVVSLTHRPPLPPGNLPGTHFC